MAKNTSWKQERELAAALATWQNAPEDVRSLGDKIRAIPHVETAKFWSQGDARRVYVTTVSLNGAGWRPGSEIVVDLVARTAVVMRDGMGAPTRAAGIDVRDAVRAILA